MMIRTYLKIGLSSLLLCPAVVGCSGGGGGGSSTSSTGFQVSNVSLRNGSVWEINREIVLSFTDPVDFTTVSANTINIRSSKNVPATGVFQLRDPRTVVFQPNCPTRDDLADAGFQPGGVAYTLKIEGANSSANTVRSENGVPLGTQQTLSFSTPASTDPSKAFQDVTPGAPVPVVRDVPTPVAPAVLDATHLLVGGNSGTVVYFERDANQDLVLSIPDYETPLNLYSDPASAVAVVIVFNQPVNPSSSNINSSRLRLEFRDSTGSWQPIDTRVSLLANCTETGARVQLEPIGILPSASQFRAVVLPGFQDLVGQTTSVPVNSFAIAPTRPVLYTSLNPQDTISDEFKEPFDFGGDSPRSFEDTQALFDSPRAEWGSGKLSAAFSFDGTGGPNHTFDWVVQDGETVFFDTTSTRINGGPNGVPVTTLDVVNGVVDVRNLIIREGGEVRVQGPNPLRINATGEVRIEGLLDLSGFSAKDVATLDTGNQVEAGGAGSAGGGKGGNANDNITTSTPRGGTGQGPFRQAGTGGQGGETGFAPNVDEGGASAKDRRRPGGGGGGRFAKDYIGTTQPAGCIVIPTAGNNGHPQSTGAVSFLNGTPTKPAKGGLPGLGAFLDARNDNDFFGTRPIVQGGVLTALIRGELSQIWAGYGGGGGGNADPADRFPTPNWRGDSDEKGGGGGGAGGALHVKALGPIVIGPLGSIFARGGQGGTGENTNFLDHIGGTGGGGSGGHIILESATIVEFAPNAAGAARESILACGPPIKTGSLTARDVDPCCKTMSNGGAGGGGIIQIHVPDAISPPSSSAATSDIVVPAAALAFPNPLDRLTSPPAIPMIPSFGARSKAQSKWISIGGADQKPTGSEGLVRFLFDGIETAPGGDEGKITTTGSKVEDRAPLVSDGDLVGSSTARILSDGFTLEMTKSALDTIRAGTTAGISNDVYLRSPTLLEDCVLRMTVVQTPQITEDYVIASGIYDEALPAPGDEALRMTVTTERGPLSGFIDRNPSAGPISIALIPRFFSVATLGAEASLPSSAFVRLRFQAAADNGFGAPELSPPLVDWTSDISKFNALPAGALQFFRFEVEFDLDANAQGVSADTEPVTLGFLRVPFVF